MPKDNTTQTFEEQVNSVVAQMTTDDKGNSVLPDIEMSEEVKYTATVEKRRRDTQASLTRARQSEKAAKLEADSLAEGWQNDAKSKLSVQQEAELEELKNTDPEAWRTKLNEIEQTNANAFKETRSTITTKAKQESELERRTRVMNEFNEKNPDINITDDFIAAEVPPKYLKQLEEDKISFEDFLTTCAKYANKDKVLDKGSEAPKTVNLGKTGGGHTPAEADRSANSVNSYKNSVF